jgi:quercetin dioxygenase-like cupin family protein
VVTGGTIVRAAGGATPATIGNGVTRHVAKGDVVIIPPNTPHWYKDVEGGITYLEVRFVAPAAATSR